MPVDLSFLFLHGAASSRTVNKTMAFVFRQGDLPKLDLQVDRGSDFKAWKIQWEAYFSLSGLDDQTAEKQVQALTLSLSRETLTIVENLGLTDAQRKSAKEIITYIMRTHTFIHAHRSLPLHNNHYQCPHSHKTEFHFNPRITSCWFQETDLW